MHRTFVLNENIFAMKRLIVFVLSILVYSGASAQEHYYQIFSIGECNHEELEVNLTPQFESNPDVLMLTMEPFEADTYSYHLFNMHGVTIRTGKVVYNKTEIVMSDYPAGGYHLIIATEEEDIQLFRIKKKTME